MRPITRPSNFRSRPEAGYALIVVMIAATVLLISLAAALPSVYQEGQREREEELIFRGNQYARAIWLFQQQFHRYPASVKELLRTNNMSFLRRPYPDPMSPNGKWRFIHAAANGAILDSWTLASRLPGGLSPSGQPPGAAAPLGATSVFSQNLPPENQASAGALGPSAQPHKTPPECKGKAGESSSSVFGNPGVQGAFIVGVASCSDKPSIRIWNQHGHYDEWEFLGPTYLPSSVSPRPVLVASPAAAPPGAGPRVPATPALPPLSDQPVSPAEGTSAPQP